MKNNLNQYQESGIRQSLPLKIFDCRERAKKIQKYIETSNELLSDLMRIEAGAHNNKIKFLGKDRHGETVSALSGLNPNTFKILRDTFAKIIRKNIEDKEQKLAEIPDAKIITVDFRNKKIDPDKRPVPSLRPRYNQLPDGPTAIYQGAWNIYKALDMGFKASDIPNLVKEKGLPAFKANGKKHWYALALDLRAWKRNEQRGGRQCLISTPPWTSSPA